MVKLLKGLFALLMVVVFLAVVGRIFVFQLGYTESYSMVPNLLAGDTFVVRTVGKLGLGDIAVCEDPEQAGSMVVLRVLGLPGQVVKFKHNHVIIDGEMVQREIIDPLLYIDETSAEQLTYAVRIGSEYVGGQQFDVALMDRAGGQQQREFTVPEEHFYLVGDNRNLARDSRNFGPAPIESCIGEAVFLLWPGKDSGDFTFKSRVFSWL
ncbi:MAG TPA: signal peptidase I [Polyangia bacterium]|nr:signal peptidase I [Polyangia bacterium]